MFRQLGIASIGLWLAVLTVPSVAKADRGDDVDRIHRANLVFQEIMSTPDRAIPQELLEAAKCIVIIPGEKKFAFWVGGSYGKGLVTCRTTRGWSGPVFLTLEGGSFGLQIGGSSTDIMMIFKDRHGLKSLLGDRFKIGVDATAAAGPVGRHLSAGTDIRMTAEILSYSRSRGVFAGVSLNGAVVEPDQSDDEALYGANVRRQDILDGSVSAPRQARSFLQEIEKCTQNNRS
jgi:lipid-binding SYLF domain-containing protein